MRPGRAPDIAPDSFHFRGVTAQYPGCDQLGNGRGGGAETFAQVKLVAHADEAGFGFDLDHQNLARPVETGLQRRHDLERQLQESRAYFLDFH